MPSGRESSKKRNIGMMPTPMVVPRMTPVRCPATRPIRVVGTTMGLGVFPLADYRMYTDLRGLRVRYTSGQAGVSGRRPILRGLWYETYVTAIRGSCQWR